MTWQDHPPTVDQLENHGFWWIRFKLEFDDEIDDGVSYHWSVPMTDIVQVLYSMESCKDMLKGRQNLDGVSYSGMNKTRIEMDDPETYKDIEWCPIDYPQGYDEFLSPRRPPKQ